MNALGWIPDLPDIRDRTAEIVLPKPPRVGAVTFAARIDLRPWMSPIEDQGSLGSCTANAGTGLLEYFERRTLGNHVDASRRFLYKVTRKLLGWKGDTGAYLRSTMKALALLGAPPEANYPYDVARFDDEPDAFAYSLASRYTALSYYRLDPAGTGGPQALAALKGSLDAGRPAMFGFTVYSSLANGPNIPFPKPTDSVRGGHAVVAAGYDDSRAVDGVPGAVLIRNSWGTSWGEAGYGWLPYAYFERRLAVDIWSLVRAAYVDLAPFN